MSKPAVSQECFNPAELLDLRTFGHYLLADIKLQTSISEDSKQPIKDPSRSLKNIAVTYMHNMKLYFHLQE